LENGRRRHQGPYNMKDAGNAVFNLATATHSQNMFFHAYCLY
jgi:hypothetical protein